MSYELLENVDFIVGAIDLLAFVLANNLEGTKGACGVLSDFLDFSKSATVDEAEDDILLIEEIGALLLAVFSLHLEI